MGVFPPASMKFLPPAWQRLMTEEGSPIVQFYPEEFLTDLNGKRHAWQGSLGCLRMRASSLSSQNPTDPRVQELRCCHLWKSAYSWTR
jgi:hypothetical protein